ncbi:gliding motility-associated C-terminal domain-containing protein [Flavobacterium algoritolerans]|uniref:Gliding motility-associated C-terminal domain-containing protein n=1 Tax=Flavobacterium algoritolerans TaxID=3041254 RepID=A0ABT6VDU9_9FLAO|nr:gliding motility-associated C-terminal domain-containing protein [Flavobacterium algoritolerans]MDI5896081.1 gliding motility-associated C-terminal domain-containing protein [Flavobacterium algoritolerans]
MKTKITLLLLTLFMFVGNIYSQFDSNHPDLRNCGTAPNYYLDLFNCESNNFELKNVYLTLVLGDGTPLTDSFCNIGDPSVQVNVMLNYTSSANNTPNNARLFADLNIDNTVIPINAYLGDIPPASVNSPAQRLIHTFTWTCGQRLSLNRALIVWRTGGSSVKLASYNCSTYNSAQCELPNNIVVSTPLVVNYNYKACRVGNNTTVQFTDDTFGGNPQYTYVWTFSDGGTSNLKNPIHTFTTLTGNTASLKITDSHGIFNSITKNILIPTELTLIGSSTNVSCNGVNDGSVTVAPSGGTGSYTYSWKNSSNANIGTTATITNLAAGTYTVEVKDANLCLATTTVSIVPASILTLGASSKTNVDCFGTNTGTITAGTITNSTGAVFYSWKNASNNIVGSTATVNNLPAGTYTLTVTDNCTTKSNNVTISQPIPVTVTASASNVTCNGAADGTITATGSVGAIITINGEAPKATYGPGTYTVLATAPNGNNNGFCTATTSVTISQPIPVTVTASASNVTCNGAADGTITATGSVGAIITINGEAPKATYGPGTYTVLATAPNGNNNGFCTATTSVTISQPIPVTVTASASNVTCNGAADGTITATGSVGAIITINGEAPKATYGPGTYTVLATAPNGNNDGFCTATTSVTISQPIPVTVTASASNVTCNGAADGTITATGSVGAIITINGEAPKATYGPGTYTVLATAPNGNNDGFCTATTSVTISQPIPVTVTASASNVTCNGAADGTITATGSVGAIITINGEAPKATYGPGTYTVLATAPNGNNDGFCTATTSVTISQPIPVTVTASASNVTCNGAADGTITATGSVGAIITINGEAPKATYGPGTYTVLATAPNGNNDGFCTATTSVTISQPIPVTVTASASNVTCNGAADGTITATGSVGAIITINGEAPKTTYGPGTYTVLATAPNGNNDGFCTATTSVTISQPIPVTVSASASNVTCNGAANGTITATGSVGAIITINGEAPKATYGLGTYTVLATAPNGNNDGFCTATTSVTISQPIPVTVSASASNVTCNGAANGTITATGSVGAIITINGEAPKATYGPGTYTVLATAPNGNNNGFCTATTSVTISQPIPVTVTASASNVTCNGAADGTITATGSVGAIITINGEAPKATYGPGTYTVLATAPNGNNNGFCTATTSVTISQPIPVTVSASASNVTCNGAANGTITATGSVGAIITINGEAPKATYGPGTYTVLATAPNGNNDGFCTATTSVTISQPIPVTVTASASNVTCNGAVDGTITATGSVGAIITINGEAPKATYGPGTYTVLATAPNGNNDGFCTATTSVTISQPIPVTVSASASNITCNGAANGTITATGSVGAIITINGEAPKANYDPGTYTVLATAPNGNNDGFCTATTSVTISQPNTLTASIINQTNVTCFGGENGSATVFVAGGTTGYTYNWNTNPSQNAATATGLAAGTYTVTVTDANGCTKTASVTINDGDGTPPIISQLPNETTINCPAIPEFAQAIATDNIDEIFSLTYEDRITQGQCTGSYTVIRTWTATDACGNSSKKSQKINVQDNTAPTFTTPSDITLSSDENCLADTSTSSTGTVTNIQDNCDSNPLATYVDSECFGNSEEQEINAGNGNYFPFTISGFDNLTAANIEKISLAFETNQGKGRAEFILVAPSGQAIKLVGSYCEGGECDDESSNTQELYLPVFYPNSSGYTKWNNNDFIQDGISQNLIPNGETPSSINILGVSTFVSSFEEFTGSMNGDWFVYSKKQATVNGSVKFKSVCLKPTSLCVGNKVISRTWTVTDACGNKATSTQTIKIIDASSPTWITGADALNTSIECNNPEALANAQSLSPIAKDNCDTDVSNITKVSGAFVASSECTNAGTYTNTWTVNDDCGNTSAVFTQVITIQDTTAPTWSTLATALNTTVECSDAEALATAQAAFPTAADLCDTDVSNITKVSGAFVASSECANAGTYTNTWTVNDDCGNTSAVFTQVITIQDTTAPTWSTLATALNTTVECSDIVALATAQAAFPAAADLCDTDVSNITKVSGAFVPSSECANAGTYTNTWTVNDDCGNTSAVFTQVITIQDTTAPTWSTQATALNTTVECSDAEALATAQAAFPAAADLCDTDVSNITKVSGAFVPSSECANAGTYTNTWTVNDDCGNISAVFTQVITIQDTTAPTWSTQATALNTTVECSDAEALTTAQAAFPAATDLCDTDVSNITKVSGAFVPSSECANAGTYTNTWTVNDDCGNTSAVFTQVITIQDTTAPTWSTQATALDTTVECSNAEALATAQAAFPAAADLCDTDVSNITKVSGVFVPSSECANAGTYTNTWTVNDDCGNTSAVFTQVITIQDTTAPTWSTQATALNTTVECSDAEALATAQAAFPAAADLCDTDVSNITKVSGAFVPSSECANAGTYTNTWTVNDDCGNTSAVFTQVITIQDTMAPTWSTIATALNTTVECSNAEALATAQAAFPAAADLCDTDVSNITKVSGVFVPSSECANAGTYTNTWTVNDDCGNTSAVFTQVITIQDTTAPTWSTQETALNTTVECSDAEALATAQAAFPTATDLCDTDVSNITKVSGAFVPSSECANAGTYTNTWTVNDDCGNTSAVFTQVITIQDTTAPIINTAASNITVECDSQGNQNAIADWLSNNGGATASDNCSDVTWSNNFNTLSNDCSTAVTVLFTVKDACGNSSTTSATFSVKDTTAPIAPEAPATITVACATDVPVSTTLTAIDNCNGEITAEGIDVIAQGDCPNSFVITRTWTFTDACSNSSFTSQIINVIDTTAPVISALPEISTISCPATPEFTQAIATDNCGSTVTMTFADVTTNGQCAGSYSVTRTWTATDACGNASTASQTINVQDTAAPVIAVLPETITISCPATPEFTQAIVTDGCGSTVTLTFADVTTNGQCAGSYSVTRTWTATDACGNASTATQTINVQDTAAPVIAALPETSTISCPATPEFTQAIATDGCGSTVTLTFADLTTNGQCAGSYSVTRTWTATDACGNASTATQTINVQDTAAPVIAALPETSTISCPATPEFTQAIATDNCGSTATLTFADVTTNGQCAGSYSVTRTWTATDACGNASTATQTINVQDTAAPVIAALPETSTISCPATLEFTQAIATDGCGSTVTLTFADVTTNGQCAGSYSVTRTWTATDACGNVSTATQTINVQDTAAPVIAALPETSTISCPAMPQFTQAIATDGCGSTVTLTFADVTTNGQCAGSYSVTRTWTATDACGNASTATQTINVQDTAAPVIAALPETSTISCPATPEFTQAIVTDGCGSTVTLTFADATTNGQCAGSYSITRTWTATDNCGNASTATQTINVQDTAAPVIGALPETSTISCPATPEFTQAIATDGCGSTVTLTFADVTTNGQCAGSYSVTRTWTATDACGNAASASQTINVQDTTAPVIATLPSASTISCPATPVFAQAIATDGCGSIVTLTFADVTTNGQCAGSYSVTRTWTATDACGNASTATQTINVQDTTAPVIAALPSASTISCPATPVFAQAIATDGCGSTVTLTFADVTTNGQCAGSYSVTRTWTATDACGNASTATQTINIVDTVGPTTATQFSSTVNVNCDAIPAKPELVFVDNCSTVSPAIFTENIINRTENSYSVVRKWSVADACGNVSVFTQTINVTIPNSVVTINSSICNDGEITTTNLNDLLPVGTPTNGTWVDVNNSGGLQGSTLNAAGLSVRDYTFEYKINDATCPRTIRITMTVNTGCGGIVLACGTVLVHNAFSPNGDGINEKFIIDNIDDTVCYPENTVEIYNRWGVLVYETKGYNNASNSFDGISGGRSTVQQSSGLPTGTYFYILNYTSVDNDGKIITNKKDGYLYLTK